MKRLAVLCSWFALFSARPAHTCEVALLHLADARMPFEGEEVPLNAELRIPNTELSFANGVVLQLERPDSTIVDVDVGLDGRGVLLSPAETLAPGAHALIIPPDAGGDRRVEFAVADEVDEEAPPAPLVSLRRETIGNPLPLRSTCDVAWPVDVVSFDVEAANDAAMVVIEFDGGRRVGGPDSPASIVESRGGDTSYDVRARDFAGNESEPTTVSTWSGCEGGCSTAGDATTVPLGLGLILGARRRRRAPCASLRHSVV